MKQDLLGIIDDLQEDGIPEEEMKLLDIIYFIIEEYIDENNEEALGEINDALYDYAGDEEELQGDFEEEALEDEEYGEMEEDVDEDEDENDIDRQIIEAMKIKIRGGKKVKFRPGYRGGKKISLATKRKLKKAAIKRSRKPKKASTIAKMKKSRKKTASKFKSFLKSRRKK